MKRKKANADQYLILKRLMEEVEKSGGLKRRKTSLYLTNVIKSYFQDRKIQTERDTDMEVGGKVPQGSVPEPILWNILYNDVM